MKVVIDKDIPFIRERIPDIIESVYLPGKEISAEAIKDAEVLIVRTRTKCDRKLLKDSKVKLIITATIGTDHIDTGWCAANNVIVRNAPGCNAPGVAQYVFASLFKAGFDPEKHTLGIIGYGNVGGIVGKWARDMGIKTLISDNPRKEAGLKDIEYRDPDTVLKESDAITLHVPLTKNGDFPTFGLIGEKQLAMMKRGGVLINTSRGGVVDEKALKDYIRQGKIKAVVDVWENEPEIYKELLELVEIGTPHIAGYSSQGKQRATALSLASLKDILNLSTDYSDLLCLTPKDSVITKDLIESSYNPLEDSKKLKAEPEKFEKLRNNYNYRNEPFFKG